MCLLLQSIMAYYITVILDVNYSYACSKTSDTSVFYRRGQSRSIFTKNNLWSRQFVWDRAARMNGVQRAVACGEDCLRHTNELRRPAFHVPSHPNYCCFPAAFVTQRFVSRKKLVIHCTSNYLSLVT